MIEKEIVIKVKVDCDNDGFGNLIELKGFDNGKPIQNLAEIVGWIQIIQHQEIKKLFRKEVKIK